MTIAVYTTGDYRRDQRTYLTTHPIIWASSALLRQAQGRDLDADGVRLMRRLVRAMWTALVAACPTTTAPIGHATAFGQVRNAIRLSYLGYLLEDESARTGSDGPVLSQAAHTALAALEQATASDDRIALLTTVVAGTSWRG